MTIKSLHRYVSLAVALIWLIQACTGMLSVFRWELDDAGVAGRSVPVDYRAVGARIDALDRAGSVSSVWTSGTGKGRFDIHYQVDEAGHVMRVDGAGTPLRIRSAEDEFAKGAVWDTITSIHTSLLAGDFGSWLIGVSGILLMTNIILGLKLAWPRRGSWRKALLGKPAGPRPARFYGWHRTLGLWFAFPALLTICAGVMMVFVDAVESGLGAQIEEPAAVAAGPGDGIDTGRALIAALGHYPGSRFSGLYMPGAETPWYKVRLHVPGEVPRNWGTSIVFVDAASGAVLSSYDASNPRPERAVVDTLYALHTGQIGAVAGRIIVLMIGAWLLTMLILGVSLWWMRRKPVRKAGTRP